MQTIKHTGREGGCEQQSRRKGNWGVKELLVAPHSSLYLKGCVPVVEHVTFEDIRTTNVSLLVVY